MADKPRTLLSVRTCRGIRLRAGLAEKPEAASKRLRGRPKAAETVTARTSPPPPPEASTAPEHTAKPKRRAATKPRSDRAAGRVAAMPSAEPEGLSWALPRR